MFRDSLVTVLGIKPVLPYGHRPAGPTLQRSSDINGNDRGTVNRREQRVVPMLQSKY